jgi:hypothetical protein
MGVIVETSEGNGRSSAGCVSGVRGGAFREASGGPVAMENAGVGGFVGWRMGCEQLGNASAQSGRPILVFAVSGTRRKDCLLFERVHACSG